MVATKCVHCGNMANVTYFPRQGRSDDPTLTWADNPALRSWIISQETNLTNLFATIDGVLTFIEQGQQPEKWRVGRCESCKKPLFLVLDQHEQNVLRSFPPVNMNRPKDVPQGVADDFIEGELCVSVGGHKAGVAMFRRALQAAAIDKGARKGTLFEQLEQLGKKGHLNSSLLDVAHGVRHFGNYGAHPEEDGLGEITKPDAEAVRDLTWQVLEDLYINPVKVAGIRATLAARLAPPQPDEGGNGGGDPA